MSATGHSATNGVDASDGALDAHPRGADDLALDRDDIDRDDVDREADDSEDIPGRQAAEAAYAQANEQNPEVEISRDLAKKGVFLGPILIAICAAIWQWDGAISSGVAVGVVIFNFLWTAVMMAAAARISAGALMGSVLFGYILRLGLILLVYLLVRNQDWFLVVPFGISLIVTHLGLLAWELRYVSLTMAYPGLKPKKSTL